MLKANNIGISISGRTICAQNISISEQNSISPVYYASYPSIATSTPIGPIQNSLNLQYLFETSDINYKLINQIRNYNFNSFPVPIVVAGLTMGGYPTNFSLEISPNDIIRASVSYSIFSGFDGSLANQSTGSYTGYNQLNSSGFGHYWTTYFKGDTSTGSIFQGTYDININWIPIYKIGQKTPVAVKFLAAQENFSFLSEYESRIAYSGEDFASKFNDFNIIEINPVSFDVGISGQKVILYPASGKITSNKIEISENNLILNNTTIIKSY
jgi:hypothetical protein